MDRLICFDIGGVLVRISQTWQEAAKYAGVNVTLADTPPLFLADADPMNRHQAGRIDYATYLDEMARLMGCLSEHAEKAHLSILQHEYVGIPEFVAEVRENGFRTACLSNTNAPHWEDLMNAAKFPTVANLEFRCASHLFQLGKPDPAIYRRFEAETGFRPDQIIFFDDNRQNVDAANQVGWLSFRIDPYGDTVAQMREALKDLEILN
jgi:putative hydrolase of the HAD superfamily